MEVIQSKPAKARKMPKGHRALADSNKGDTMSNLLDDLDAAYSDFYSERHPYPSQYQRLENAKLAVREELEGNTPFEYGYELIETDTRNVVTRSGAFESEQAALHWGKIAVKGENPPLDLVVVRRRKAGPWVADFTSGS